MSSNVLQPNQTSSMPLLSLNLSPRNSTLVPDMLRIEAMTSQCHQRKKSPSRSTQLNCHAVTSLSYLRLPLCVMIPSPRPQSVATRNWECKVPAQLHPSIEHFNRLADRLAPQRRSKAGHERWVNAYTHNVGGLTEVKMVDVAATILAKCCDVTTLLDTRISSQYLSAAWISHYDLPFYRK